MTLVFDTDRGEITAEAMALTVAGWTGRDQAAVRHHVEELAAIGVPRPSETPLFYRVSADLLTQADRIDVLGHETSGEVEPFLIRLGGALWLGLGSDHTDRGLEAVSVAHSKQVCAKPVARSLWRLGEVEDRLDRLRMTTWIGDGDTREVYQQGTLAGLLPLRTLLDRAPLGEGEAMLCGTVPAIGGVRPATDYEMELADPGTGAAIRLSYRAAALPVIR